MQRTRQDSAAVPWARLPSPASATSYHRANDPSLMSEPGSEAGENEDNTDAKQDHIPLSKLVKDSTASRLVALTAEATREHTLLPGPGSPRVPPGGRPEPWTHQAARRGGLCGSRGRQAWSQGHRGLCSPAGVGRQPLGAHEERAEDSQSSLFEHARCSPVAPSTTL